LSALTFFWAFLMAFLLPEALALASFFTALATFFAAVATFFAAVFSFFAFFAYTATRTHPMPIPRAKCTACIADICPSHVRADIQYPHERWRWQRWFGGACFPLADWKTVPSLLRHSESSSSSCCRVGRGGGI